MTRGLYRLFGKRRKLLVLCPFIDLVKLYVSISLIRVNRSKCATNSTSEIYSSLFISILKCWAS